MHEFVLTQEKADQLAAMIGEIPTRYGMQILQALNALVEKRELEAQLVKPGQPVGD